MEQNISTNVVLFIIMLFCLTISACGGGGSSSDTSNVKVNNTSNPSTATPEKAPIPQNQAPNDNNSGKPNTLANFIELNPLRDLGVGKGKSICFKLKSYNNVTESAFSESVCGQIKNDHSLVLTWNNASGNIVGYYVYFSDSKNNSNNKFLADVIKS